MFEKINELLEDTDYPMEITDISDLEEFLNNEENSNYEVYDEIAHIYDQIMEGGDLYSDDEF
jgi:predicted Zn-ribbon and HTH transcriptional regulator